MNDQSIRSDNIETVITSPSSSPLVSSSTLLEISRRVDWRFLLPNPNLNHVAVAGNVSPSLRESLSLFSQRVTYLEAPFTQDHASLNADLVILCGSLKTHLPSLLALVKPAGYIYVESTVRRSINSFRRGHPLLYGVDLFKQYGFEDIQSHWHMPDFESCKRIIPLNTPDALVFALNKSESRAIRQAINTTVNLAHKTRLLLWVASSFSLIARRGVS